MVGGIESPQFPINGERNLKVSQLKSGKSSEPNLHFWGVFRVNFGGCILGNPSKSWLSLGKLPWDMINQQHEPPIKLLDGLDKLNLLDNAFRQRIKTSPRRFFWPTTEQYPDCMCERRLKGHGKVSFPGLHVPTMEEEILGSSVNNKWRSFLPSFTKIWLRVRVDTNWCRKTATFRIVGIVLVILWFRNHANCF